MPRIDLVERVAVVVVGVGDGHLAPRRDRDRHLLLPAGRDVAELLRRQPAGVRAVGAEAADPDVEVGGLDRPADDRLRLVVDADRRRLATGGDLDVGVPGGAGRREARVQAPAVPVWSDSHATAKSPLKLAATDGCVCWPPVLAFATRRDSVTAPLVRPSRIRPTLYDALASPSSSQTTTASPEADTATSGLWCCPVVVRCGHLVGPGGRPGEPGRLDRGRRRCPGCPPRPR